MSTEAAIKQAKISIDEYNQQILSFLSEDGKSSVKAAVFVSTYSEIQRVSDECDRSDAMYNYYIEILKNYINKKIIPAIRTNYGSSSDYIVEYDKQWK